MSQAESSIGSSAGAAPPSAPSTAATPSEGSPQPVAATPAAAVPAAPNADAAAPSTTPGAPPSDAKPTSLDEVHKRYHTRLEGIAGTEGAQPTPPPAPLAEEAPVTPPPAKVEAQPEPQPAVEEPPAEPPAELAAPEAPDDVIQLDDGTDYRERTFTAEDLAKQFPRVPKSAIAEIAKFEAHRGELLEERDAIGGDVGARISKVINPIILNVENPTDEHVDAILDQLTLPENAHAVALVDKMGKRLVNLQLQDETCGSCHGDGREANPECSSHISTGREFGSNMISEEWGKKADGTPFDFWGMKPIEFVDTLVKAAQYVDGDGQSLINKEFIEGELAANKPAELTEREKKLLAENEELRAKTKTETEAAQAEQKRTAEQNKAVYKTQATGVVRNFVSNAILPLATKANWIAIEGEEGSQVGTKKTWGRLVINDIQTQVLGTVAAPTPAYQEVLDMIENQTAFDITGKITPRFQNKLNPLARTAKALFAEIEREMGGQFKFTAQNSRAAKLVKESGQQAQPAAEPPPLAVPKPPQPENLTTEDRLAARKKQYREDVARANATAGVLG